MHSRAISRYPALPTLCSMYREDELRACDMGNLTRTLEYVAIDKDNTKISMVLLMVFSSSQG